MKYCYLETPIGKLLLAGKDDELHCIAFPNGKMKREPDADWMHVKSAFPEARRQLKEYFAGKRQVFDLKLAPNGTPFQRQVLDALQQIPYGETASYADIARKLGRPGAARAVGAANGRNPLPIVIPCHRVIGSKGALTGFGGGIETKKALLALENPTA